MIDKSKIEKFSTSCKYYQLLKNYSQPLSGTYNPSFRDICLKFGIIGDAKGISDRVRENYNKIITFVTGNMSENNTPFHCTCKDDKKIVRLYNSYKHGACKYRHTSFILKLEDICKRNGIIKNENKIVYYYECIKYFVHKYKKIPSTTSKNKEEKKLGRTLANFKLTPSKHSDFLVEIEELRKKYGILSTKERVEKNYSVIELFIIKNGYAPLITSIDLEERRLSALYSNYKRGKHKKHHVNFIAKMHKVLMEKAR